MSGETPTRRPRATIGPDQGRGFPEQNEAGVDLSLIRANLRLSPTERVQRNWEQRGRIQQLRDSARRIG